MQVLLTWAHLTQSTIASKPLQGSLLTAIVPIENQLTHYAALHITLSPTFCHSHLVSRVIFPWNLADSQEILNLLILLILLLLACGQQSVF